MTRYKILANLERCGADSNGLPLVASGERIAPSKLPQVPVLIYHSVANDHHHPWRHLSLPVCVFERQLLYLKRHGFNTISLYELHAHLKAGSALPPKPVVLSFDDGFLDNWVHAFPMLRKYGMKATIFVTPDFIDPSLTSRPNLEDVWSGKVPSQDLAWWGYLSWSELRLMHESGLVDVQSHSQTHTCYFTSDKVVDFHHPHDGYPWLSWNAYPERKYLWLTEESPGPVPWGSPVYDFSPSLQQKRFYPDPELADITSAYVVGHGGRDFFRRPGWKEDLLRVVVEYRPTVGSRGDYETDEDYLGRVRTELIQSKNIIAAELKKPVDFLCWPYGAFTETVHRIAVNEAGYLATLSIESTPNKFGGNFTKIGRTYFGQEYQGPCRAGLIFLKFVGKVHQQRGLPLFYVLVLLANRLMRLLNFLRDHIGTRRASVAA